MSAVPDAHGSLQALVDLCASYCKPRLAPVGRPSSIADEVSSSSLPPLPADALESLQAFETHLIGARDAPLPIESEEDRRLVRHRYTKRFCALIYRTVNQAIILEEDTVGSDIQLKFCDLLMRQRVPLNDPSQWGSLIDEGIAPVIKSKSSVLEWNEIFSFLQKNLQDSFHMVYIIITDQMIQNKSKWLSQFLIWCFINGNQFCSQGTNLIMVPWFKNTTIKIPDSIGSISIQSIFNSSSRESIKTGQIIKQLIMHRFLLFKSMFIDSVRKALVTFTIRDLAEFCYAGKCDSLFKETLLNNTDVGNQDTDMCILSELVLHLHSYQHRLVKEISMVMRSPEQWTRDSVQLEAGQSVSELYMNTIYYGRAKSFWIGRMKSLASLGTHQLTGSDIRLLVQYQTHESVVADIKNTLRGLKCALESALKSPEKESPSVYQLFTFVSPLRCINYLTLYQEPPVKLLDMILYAVQLCPTLIKSLIHSHENYCGIIEVIVFELLYFELQLFSILSSKNNCSQVVGFSWKLLKTIASIIEPTALVIMRFNTLDTTHFKGEFVVGLLGALGELLKRGAEVLTEGVCTEPNPGETFNRLEECIIKLDVDHWYSRIHDWSIGAPNSFQGTNYIVFNAASLNHLSSVCQVLEKLFRCTLHVHSFEEGSTHSETDGNVKHQLSYNRQHSPTCLNPPQEKSLRKDMCSSPMPEDLLQTVIQLLHPSTEPLDEDSPRSPSWFDSSTESISNQATAPACGPFIEEASLVRASLFNSSDQI